MIISTTDSIPGKDINEVIGVVRGNTVRAKHIGKDVFASLRSLLGGEITEYVEALSEAREEAMDRMLKEAEALNADAVVNIRFATSQVMPGAAELLAYGTAVKFKE